MWPTTGSFHSNWPLIANDLIVGDWKIAGAESLSETAEIDEALLDPPPALDVDWHDTYAGELAGSPAIAKAMALKKQGDGIEVVLEQARLSIGERVVMRAWLYNPDLAQVAEDLHERPQTVATLYRNATHRLRWLGSHPGVDTPRGQRAGPESNGVRASVAPRLEAAAARTLTEKIQGSPADRWQLLVAAYEQKAWKPLGYNSWYAYAVAEFHIDERQTEAWLERARAAAALEVAAAS